MMDADTTRPVLSAPLDIREMRLKNRLVISPMCMYSAVDGCAGNFHLAHLGRFALGGAGLVFVEATAVSRVGRITSGCLGLWSDEQELALTRVVQALHDGGTAVGIQLNHSGRKGSAQRPWEGMGSLQQVNSRGAWETVGATTEPIGPGWPPVHALDHAEIVQIVGEFAAAAGRANRAGFDVLEIHCAHGYLIHQFLSPISNKRNDRYGGSLASRMRFALEVIEATRAAWPAAKPLFARLSVIDGIDAGWSSDDSVVFARELKFRGVDVIDCSSGGMKLPTGQRIDTSVKGFHVPYAQEIRARVDIATIAVGLITDIEYARSIVKDGKADLIGLGRTALADSHWPARALQAEEGVGSWNGWPHQHRWWLERWPAQHTVMPAEQNPESS